VDHEVDVVGEFDQMISSRLPAGSGPFARILGGSASGSRSMTLRALFRAWPMTASSMPCLRADRWISTSQYRNT